MATVALGGGAARPERRRVGLGGFVEERRCAERLFIGLARRWRGEAPVVAGRLPLMAPRASTRRFGQRHGEQEGGEHVEVAAAAWGSACRAALLL